jgi:MFS family permease
MESSNNNVPPPATPPADPAGSFRPAKTLFSRTYIGLLIAQFLAAFNDQAIHAAAMFFAISRHALSLHWAISLMPILFYAPWALFPTLAGYLADRYSKRTALVFWKFAEIGITAIALLGFWLGSVKGDPYGPWIVLSTVFLMGLHSTFFVPAKYGVMPEILEPHLLSRGNGFLESTSFLAVILGTVTGGVLSSEFAFKGQEYWIGVDLIGLAVIGALASLFIQRMPAADKNRPFPGWLPWKLYRPLYSNLRVLFTSQPLILAVLGIAFFTFITAFMRATVYMHGESRGWDELHTSLVVGMVAVGIGLGSPLAGVLSGGKVELGLVPLGALGMVAATAVAAFTLDYMGYIGPFKIHAALIGCIIAIGFCTGFYIVPLFTLLQHRSPKTSKGDSIATSNFINVTGAIVASVLFLGLVYFAKRLHVVDPIPQQDDPNPYVLKVLEDRHAHPVRVVLQPVDGGSEVTLDSNPEDEEQPRDIEVVGVVKEDTEVRVSTYTLHDVNTLHDVKHYRVRPADHGMSEVYNYAGLPMFLFLGASVMTLLSFVVLLGRLPDLFVRTNLWWHLLRFRSKVLGVTLLPGNGPVILATNCQNANECLTVWSATDRWTRFVLVKEARNGRLLPFTGVLSYLMGVAPLTLDLNRPDHREKVLKAAERALRRGEVIGLPERLGDLLQELLKRLPESMHVPVVPVYAGLGIEEEETIVDNAPPPPGKRYKFADYELLVVFGAPMEGRPSLELLRKEVKYLGRRLRSLTQAGVTATTTVMFPGPRGIAPRGKEDDRSEQS